MGNGQLTIHYHRDFDGMCAGAILAHILRERGEEDLLLRSVNYDQRRDWEGFAAGERFAIVDFPQPLFPTSATVSPGFAFSVTLFKMTLSGRLW